MVNLSDPDRYAVEFMPIDDIYPSPENDEIYGAVEHDDQMDDLIESIREHGLEEPIIVSSDDYIISGHRRLYACQHLGMETVPVRIKAGVCHDDNENGDDWHRLLASYNPQRQKSAASLLREALMRETSGAEVFAAAEAARKAKATDKDVQFMVVKGDKKVKPLTARTSEFIAAAILIINSMREYWPLSVRQIHYKLLNDPPMKQTIKTPREKNRYINDDGSYEALSRLLLSARYEAVIPWACLADETRPCMTQHGFDNLGQFVRQEMEHFLAGYHRDLQQGQPHHIEFLGEKNTLKNIVAPVLREFHVPGMFGRGYGNPSVWVDAAQRFRASGKESMILIVGSDYDPEGLDLPDDAVRSLRDKFDIPIRAVRCAVNREQIEELDLVANFNPAKATSTRIVGFCRKIGWEGSKDDIKERLKTGEVPQTWEIEALPTEYFQQSVREAITSVIDTDIFNAVVEQQKADCDNLYTLKQEMGSALGM